MLPNSCHIKSLIISSNEKHHTITSKIKYKIEAHLWMRGGVTRVTTNLLLSQMTDVWSHPGHRCALLSEKWRGGPPSQQLWSTPDRGHLMIQPRSHNTGRGPLYIFTGYKCKYSVRKILPPSWFSVFWRSGVWCRLLWSLIMGLFSHNFAV